MGDRTSLLEMTCIRKTSAIVRLECSEETSYGMQKEDDTCLTSGR